VPGGSRSVAVAAGGWTAAAAWLSCGAIAFGGANGRRYGVLPSDALHIAISVAAGLVVFAIASVRPRRVLIALAPLALTILPWLPIRVPAAVLIWTGALVTLPWIAATVALAAIVFEGRWRAPRGSAIAAGAVSFAVFAACAWLTSPSRPAGDEPHYLVVTQSLLYDHDLRIENNHQRGDYRAYFHGDLLPHYVRRGRNGAIYSIQAPGVPAFVLPAFALGGYRGVVVFLLLVSAAAAGLAWWLAWRVTGDAAAAWFGWAAVTLTAPFLLESFTVLPDGPGAALVLVGVWALLEREGDEAGEGYEGAGSHLRWLFFGAAFAAMPWLHARFAVIAATLGGLVLVRLAHAANAMSKAVVFLSVPAISALAWLFFFAIVYGAPDPTAPYGGDPQFSFAFLTNGLGGLLFDQGFGLFATAPVMLVAIAGFARTRRFALEWAVVAAPYVMAVGTFAVWWAGMSGPARLLVPLILPLAIPAACAWTSASSRGARTAMLALLTISVWLALVMAGGGGGRLGFHTRSDSGMTAAPWLEWANTLVDLPSASPAYVPMPSGAPATTRADAASSGLAATLPWLVSVGGALWLAVWFVDRRTRTREAAISLISIACAVAVMIAAAAVWMLRGRSPVTIVPAQMEALRASAFPHAVALDLTGRQWLPISAARAMPIEVPIRVGGRFRPRGNRPLASFPMAPPGSYRLSVTRHGAADGWIMAGVGNDQFSIVTARMTESEGGVPIELPVQVSTLSVRAEEAGRDQLDAVVLRPTSLAAPARSSDLARRAVRYGESGAFFLDEMSYAEPGGFWVVGGAETTVVIAPDHPAAAIPLWIRNGTAINVVALDSGVWRTTVRFLAGEERRVDVPVTAAQTSARVRINSAATFRPSDADPNSRDTRLLGVFVRLTPDQNLATPPK
jgi:hypothetical protein